MRNEYERPIKKIKILIETIDGASLETLIIIGHSDNLSNYLNNSVVFLEIEDAGGRRSFLAKSSVQRLIPLEDETKTGKKSVKTDEKTHLSSKDPYLVMDIGRDAGDEELREAYHKLVRAYHPDRLAGLELPTDILAHGEDILKKVNAAYDTIVRERKASKTSAA